jgi:hypothetical protein
MDYSQNRISPSPSSFYHKAAECLTYPPKEEEEEEEEEKKKQARTIRPFKKDSTSQSSTATTRLPAAPEQTAMDCSFTL